MWSYIYKNICLSASAKEIIWSWRNGCIGFERCEEGQTTSQGQELNKGNLERMSISLHRATLSVSLAEAPLNRIQVVTDHLGNENEQAQFWALVSRVAE